MTGALSASELAIALSFAKLEIIEVQNGYRDITRCPGIDNLARHINAIKAFANHGTECKGREK